MELVYDHPWTLKQEEKEVAMELFNGIFRLTDLSIK
jgi:hypothetical protein